MPRALVIIPAYNEENNIEEVVRRSQAYADVCVVDDHSTDRTPAILDSIEGVHVFIMSAIHTSPALSLTGCDMPWPLDMTML
jgi:glycosyltransferase involved in cell wall biosynthesis